MAADQICRAQCGALSQMCLYERLSSGERWTCRRLSLAALHCSMPGVDMQPTTSGPVMMTCRQHKSVHKDGMQTALLFAWARHASGSTGHLSGLMVLLPCSCSASLNLPAGRVAQILGRSPALQLVLSSPEAWQLRQSTAAQSFSAAGAQLRRPSSLGAKHDSKELTALQAKCR